MGNAWTYCATTVYTGHRDNAQDQMRTGAATDRYIHLYMYIWHVESGTAPPDDVLRRGRLEKNHTNERPEENEEIEV